MRKTAANVLSVLFVALLCGIGMLQFQTTLLNTGKLFTEQKLDLAAFVKTETTQYAAALKENDPNPLANRYSYVSLNGLLARFMGQRYVNGVIKLNNGSLVLDARIHHNPDSTQLPKTANDIKRLSEAVTRSGGTFVYMQIPYKVDKDDPALPAGSTETLSKATDRMLGLLVDNGVTVIDLQEELRNSGVSVYDALHKTDHHWTLRTCFWAFEHISDQLLSKWQIPNTYPQLDINNYTVTDYPNKLLGSEGQRVGYWYVPADSITTIVPNFETDILNITTGTRDPFETLLLATDKLDATARMLSEAGLYKTVNDSNMEAKFHNYSKDAIDKRLIIIGDSNIIRIAPYFATAYKEVRVLFANHSEIVSKKNIDKHIAEFSPDAVIYMQTDMNIIKKDIYK